MADTMEVVSAGQGKDSTLAEEEPGIVKRAEEAEVLANVELLCNLRQMVNEPAFSDVVFICNDGIQVQASRLLLASRSKVLNSMLMNGMTESRLSEIKVPEICSPVLLAVFEFLYTGTLCDYQPQGWGIACRVIIASRFLLLPSLEMITRKFMHSLTSAAVEDLPKAACMLTEALALNLLCDNTDANVRELVTILSSNWSDSMYVKSLSEAAFDYLLKNSCLNFVDTVKLSFKEYLRFRQVIRWWVYKSDYGFYAAEELLTFIAPGEKEALHVCRDPDSFARDESATETVANLAHDWHYWRTDDDSRRSAMRLMSNIDFRWIRPALLAKVVEPLEVVSAAKMLDYFRYHALRRRMFFETDCCWEHGTSHCVFGDGYEVQKRQVGVGLAVMTATMSRSFGVHQWRFIVHECCLGSVEMGFMSYGSKKPKLDGEKLSDQHGARVLKFQRDGVSVTTRTGGSPGWRVLKGVPNKLNRSVVFSYDAFEHRCSLSFNCRDYGICWKDLPSEVYYPAVSLGSGSEGRIRVELLSGFDSL